MPSNTPQNPNSSKKVRLGRGLGSLFGGLDMPTDIHDPSVATPATQQMTSEPTTASKTGAKSSEPSRTLTGQSPGQMPSHGSLHRANPTSVQTNNQTNNQVASQKASHQTSQMIDQRSTDSVAKPVQTSAEQRTAGMMKAPLVEIISNPPTSETSAIGARVITPLNEETQIWMISIDKLKPNTQQPRQLFTPDGLRDLTASVKEKGILQPIVARRLGEREFEIIAGERRWRAAQAAGLHQVPVILKKVSEQDSLELAIIENIQRENLNPIDEAEAFQHLINDYSMTQQMVADKMGKERSSVANSLRLLSLPGEVRMMLKGNEISTGHAKVLLGIEDKAQQLEIAKQIIEGKLSVRATEKLVAKAKTETRGIKESKDALPQKADIAERMVEALGLELQKLIGTKVAIDYADSKGKIAIHFYSDDQFNQMVEKLRRAWEK